MYDDNEIKKDITEKKAIETITKRIGFLAMRIGERTEKEASYDVSEKNALIKILNSYSELKKENIRLKEILDYDNQGNVNED